jgi:hypothetical protein
MGYIHSYICFFERRRTKKQKKTKKITKRKKETHLELVNVAIVKVPQTCFSCWRKIMKLKLEKLGNIYFSSGATVEDCGGAYEHRVVQLSYNFLHNSNNFF